MRAGCFAERRVIDLLNRRFVTFYFNRSGQGEGGSDAATAFVNGQTDNKYAYFAAFSPDGKIVGETDLYADKDATFDWTVKLLADHPEFAGMTSEEKAVFDKSEEANLVEIGRLEEELGQYAKASEHYTALMHSTEPNAAAEGGASLLRVQRYLELWKEQEETENVLRKVQPENASLLVVLDLERGRRLLTAGKTKPARALLQDVSRRAAGRPRHAEAHFYAGVACWFDDDRSWAKLHWCWVNENLHTDRLARRAYIAAAAEAMPYANAELGGFKADVGSIGTGDIVRGYRSALRVHKKLLPAYDAGENSGGTAGQAPVSAAAPGDVAAKAAALVAELRDGNAHVAKNNPMVEELVSIGKPALAPLVKAVNDETHPGRGYSGWALGRLLASLEERPQFALNALEGAANSSDSYVSALSRSGRSQISAAPQSSGNEQALPESALLLVSGLRDGNASVKANNHRIVKLQKLGADAVPSLMAAMADKSFPGRGYAGWALSQVIKSNQLDDDAAIAALEKARKDKTPYVRELARSGLATLD